MSDARAIAYAVLRRVEEQDAFANLALDAELSSAGVLDPRDAALATELAYGVLRRRVALDRALSPLVKGGLAGLEDRVRDLLRLGAYQLLYTRIPPHAAVGETVNTARRVGLARAAGLINAVLRRLGREGAPALPDPASDPLGALEVQGSLPRWLAERLLSRLGIEEALAFAAAIDQPAPPTLRVNRKRTTRETLEARLATEAAGARISRTPLAEDGLLVEGGGSLARLPAFAEGLFSQQDEAAQLVGELCGPAAGARVLDACAAPGGKSCHLAERGAGEVISVDVHERKARRIGDEARRLGLDGIVRPLGADASKPLPAAAKGPFDLVLVDAPCSALGTLRRHPELRYRRTPEDVARMVETQALILDNVATEVRPGGILVYAVCSILPEEGPDQVRAFLERQGGAFVKAPLEPAPGWSEGGWILDAWPQRQGIDGFYAARLRRT
ncbi:16S rRNA (cytosine(967)-C(5))-methyltransferase RsmB [Vulgatibacter sp.]|uniref:16S rRNA (cytosine(967)-C(5))-methyltransferase RsmB n=1 Tax=Vulgatibacter sp. TaxID=1971226 RepID=UPI003568A80E